jgi:hypothetical protein
MKILRSVYSLRPLYSFRYHCGVYKPSLGRTNVAKTCIDGVVLLGHKGGSTSRLRCYKSTSNTVQKTATDDREDRTNFNSNIGESSSSTVIDGTETISSCGTIVATSLEDFSGERVTFLHPNNDAKTNRQATMKVALEALDIFQIGIITRGKTFFDGGDSEGDSIQASHAAAISWSDFLLQARAFNNDTASSEEEGLIVSCRCPMLTVAAVAPLICQTGVHYVKYLDRRSAATATEFSILPMAQRAVQQLLHNNDKSSPTRNLLSNRERLHLEALNFLIQNMHTHALSVYLHILTLHPGDVFALALAIDVAYVVGKPIMALRAATSVSRYIDERRQRGAALFISGYNVALSWVSLGLALGGKYRDAEAMAQSASPSSSGGVSSASLSVVYDGEGRITEGCSLLMGFDGIQNYKDCGWLAFDAKLAGYGARFILDRDGNYGGNLALRAYDDYFGHRLISTTTASNGRVSPQKTPNFLRRAVQAGKSSGKSVLQSVFGIGFNNNPVEQTSYDDESKIEHDARDNGNIKLTQKALLENLLTFLPPTPQLLVDSTLLLLRITLAGVITPDDERWCDLKEAWKQTLSELEKETNGAQPLQFYPLADSLSALLSDSDIDESDTANKFSRSKQALFEMGKLMSLGIKVRNEAISKSEVEKTQERWSRIVSLLASSSEGRGWPTLNSNLPLGYSEDYLAAHDQDLRPILSHAICHAAVLSKSYESLNIARAICSEDVTLRPNCAESWWRYSLILDELGDSVAAENARMACKTFGSGIRGFKSGWNFLQ